MSSSLYNSKRAMKGEIVMNGELDGLSTSLFNGFLPGSWAGKALKTDEKLGSWMDHFLKRFA